MTYSDTQVGEIVEGLAGIQSLAAQRTDENAEADQIILGQAIDVLLSSAKGWHGTVWCDGCAGAGTVLCHREGERTCSICKGAGYFTPVAVIALRDSGSDRNGEDALAASCGASQSNGEAASPNH